MRGELPLVIKPKLHRHIPSRILRGQRPERIDPLQRAHCRLIEGWHSARLLHANIRRRSRAVDLEVDVHTPRGVHSRIDFILHPVVGDLAPHPIHVPAEAATEISRAAAEAQSALSIWRGERSIWSADRAAFPERNLVVLNLRDFLRRRLLLSRLN